MEAQRSRIFDVRNYFSESLLRKNPILGFFHEDIGCVVSVVELALAEGVFKRGDFVHLSNFKVRSFVCESLRMLKLLVLVSAQID